MTTLRLLPFTTADGPHNMAADEALLESAAAGVASLRFYAWSKPMLSLGYFQAAALRLSDPLLAGLPFVRRPSGGGALVHDREITYALALPAGPPWQVKGESWLCRMHGVITAALAALGASARSVGCGEERKLGELLCFQHQTPADLLISGRKIVGSAQRRQRGALMQHGSILLARSPHTPGLPGLRELAGVEISPENLAAAVCDDFQRETGWDVAPGDRTTAERQRVEELAAGKYDQDSWNRKR
jgi:lipoate-protein ligase A